MSRPIHRPSRIFLPRPVAATLLAAARGERPREACGLLVGRQHESRREVVRAESARNVDSRPVERYHLAPEDFLAGEKLARAEGLEVLGFWHSHPTSEAVPSEVDRRRAWEGYSYLIVSLASGQERPLRAWRLQEGTMAEEEIVVGEKS